MKRKITKTHIKEILEEDEQDLLGVCQEDEADFANLDDGETEEEITPYLFHNDENPVTNDPYYYDQNELLQSKTALYEPSDKTEDSEEGASISQELAKELELDEEKAEELKGIADDEYDEDSSDEEEIYNTAGSIPMQFYNDYDHLGYDHDGNRILKPDRGDSLDALLKRLEDPDYRRTIFDPSTGQDVKLVEGDLELVQNILKGSLPSAKYDLYEKFEDLYSHEVMETPLSGRPEHKRSFLPSKADRDMVSKMVHAAKQGAIHKHIRKKRYDVTFDLWNSDTVPVPMKRKIHRKFKAPSEKLPTNMNSYNPPPEFLINEQALKWIESKPAKQKKVIEEKLARKYDSVRTIPADVNYVMKIFNRCLDMYMCTRVAIKRPVGKSKDLLPDLPRPRDLRPYPTSECLSFEGHKSVVRSIAIHPSGHLMASGSDDQTVKIWNTATSRCIRTIKVKDFVSCVSWCPNTSVFILAVAVGNCLVLINPESYLVDHAVIVRTNAVLKSMPDQGDYEDPEIVKKTVTWLEPSDEERAEGYRVVIKHTHPVKMVTWHPQGDFFATLQPEAKSLSIVTHQLSRWRSQLPFDKAAMDATAISFHPKKPYFYICNKGRVRIYSLLERKLHRHIKACQTSSIMPCIAVHPSGDHFITGSTGQRVTWYEMDNTDRPFVLRYHRGVIRSVAFHNKYPLFASASDDGRVIITHSMVYSDKFKIVTKDPLLVPVKELRTHQFLDTLCVLNVQWHPQEPWLFTAGADGSIRMWQ